MRGALASTDDPWCAVSGHPSRCRHSPAPGPLSLHPFAPHLLPLARFVASPSGKRLTALTLSFREAGVAHIAGTFAMDATTATKKAEFDFVIDCALGSSQTTDVVFDILEASVRLNAVEVFHSTRTNPQPVGALLDFLAPAIENAVERGLRRAETTMEERFAAARPSKDMGVADVLYVEGNRLGIRLLPHLLSPILPPLTVGRIAVTNGMLQVALSIAEVK